MARAVPMGRQRRRVMKHSSMESYAVRELLLYVPKGSGGMGGGRVQVGPPKDGRVGAG